MDQALDGCSHTVARCEACRLHHRLYELYADRFCARCRADLTLAVRRHLRDCAEIVIRRRSFSPGHAVSFRHGTLVHLACYENGARRS